MQQLISAREAALRIGVSTDTIKKWMHRSEHPLPNITIGATGKQHRVLAAEIETWLAAEAARKAAGTK